MKIRSCYVSNSSSSSFIVTKDLSDKGITCLKLSKEQIELINGSSIEYDDSKKFELDPSKDYWLTEFIYDIDDEASEELMEDPNRIVYSSGQMSMEPYDLESFNKYDIDGEVSIYIRKEHDVAKQMTFAEFIKNFLDENGNSALVA